MVQSIFQASRGRGPPSCCACPSSCRAVSLTRSWLILLIALLASGCVLRRARPPVAVAPPPKPPENVQPQPPPKPPVSVPQTQVRLPAPQPISPEALAAIPTYQEEPGSRAPARTPRRTSPVVVGPKPDIGSSAAQSAAENPA